MSEGLRVKVGFIWTNCVEEDDFLLQAAGYNKCILHFRNGGKYPGFSLCPGLVRISLSLSVCQSVWFLLSHRRRFLYLEW